MDSNTSNPEKVPILDKDAIWTEESVKYPFIPDITLESDDCSTQKTSFAPESKPLSLYGASTPVMPDSAPTQEADFVQNVSWYKCKRQYVPILCFFAVFVMYLVRFALSHGQYAMQAEMGWTEEQIGFIQSSFYIGYLPTQLVGGYFSRSASAKYVNLWGLLLSCLTCALFPVCVTVYPLMIILRVFMGFGQGVMYPAMVELLSHWLLPGEKSFFLNLAWSGGQAGTIFVFAIHPVIIRHLNWQWGFYLFSISGLVWAICWVFFVFDKPDKHPSLCPEERALLAKRQQRSQQSTPLTSSSLPSPQSVRDVKTTTSIPWRMLLTSRSIYILMIIYFCYNWTFYLFINNIPTYQKNVLSVGSELLSATAMVPYVLLWASLLASGIASDALVRRGLPLLRVRKLMVCVGFLPCAILLAFVKYYEQHSTTMTLTMTILAVGISGISMSGFSPNSMDLAPEYAGVITSLCNIFGSSSGIIGPIFTAAVFKRYECSIQANTEACHTAWILLFQIAAGIYLFGAIVWLFFASVKPINFTKRVSPSQA